MNSLFPQPYLNIGSRGPAVVVLQLMLLALRYNPKIVPDGDYGEETAQAVRELQADFELEQDGNFGPNTRAAFRLATLVDVNLLEASLFVGDPVAPLPQGVLEVEIQEVV